MCGAGESLKPTARAARRLSERAIQGLFDQADSDKDGYISFIDVQRSQRETLRARKQAAQQVSSVRSGPPTVHRSSDHPSCLLPGAALRLQARKPLLYRPGPWHARASHRGVARLGGARLPARRVARLLPGRGPLSGHTPQPPRARRAARGARVANARRANQRQVMDSRVRGVFPSLEAPRRGQVATDCWGQARPEAGPILTADGSLTARKEWNGRVARIELGKCGQSCGALAARGSLMAILRCRPGRLLSSLRKKLSCRTSAKRATRPSGRLATW